LENCSDCEYKSGHLSNAKLDFKKVNIDNPLM